MPAVRKVEADALSSGLRGVGEVDVHQTAHARDELIHQAAGLAEIDVLRALADLRQTLGAEGALRVDVQRLALAAALLHRQLADDGERVTELRLARSELSVELGEGPRFHSPYVSVGVLVEVPPRIASSSLHPVDMWMRSSRSLLYSVAFN